MRIWTLDPGYLDAKGLVAVWRETLLAQKVLKGATKGYKAHPQLIRFRKHADPIGAVATYLDGICAEARRRGYKFCEERIAPARTSIRIQTFRGQLLFEWQHLKGKLKERDRKRYSELLAVQKPRAHPLFRIVAGGLEDWERPGRRRARVFRRSPAAKR